MPLSKIVPVGLSGVDGGPIGVTSTDASANRPTRRRTGARGDLALIRRTVPETPAIVALVVVDTPSGGLDPVSANRSGSGRRSR